MENFNQEVDSLRKTWREIEEQRRGNPDLLGGDIGADKCSSQHYFKFSLGFI